MLLGRVQVSTGTGADVVSRPLGLWAWGFCA